MIMRWFVLCGDGGIFPRHLLRFFLRLNDVIFCVERFYWGKRERDRDCSPAKKITPLWWMETLCVGNNLPKK